MIGLRVIRRDGLSYPVGVGSSIKTLIQMVFRDEVVSLVFTMYYPDLETKLELEFILKEPPLTR
jgi:hypothetical protein